MAFVIIDDPVGGLSSTVRCGSSNNARSPYSTVSGGALNTSSGKYSTISGGYLNTTNKDYSVIGGGLYNTTIDAFNTIGGGSRNTSQKNYSTIGGGFSNTTNGCFTTIAGGRNNKSQANYSTIIGGCNNIANGIGSMVFGFDNTANGYNSVVLGGSNIVGNNNDTVYVPYLNISFLQTGTSVNNLGIDVNGNVVTGGLQPDVYITGGTIDYNTGDLTLDNNNSTSVVISGLQDIYATGGTFTLNTLTIENNDGSSFDVTGFTSGGGSYESLTYMELKDMVTGGTLTPGGYYLINDYQTCYDQPDFDYNGNTITTPETYHVSDVEQLLVFATSSESLSPTAYSLVYPNDKITYDYSFSFTEATTNPAKGRITERIDEYGNRTDYDHRSILFKRYRSYFSDGEITGRIISMNNGDVTGLNTFFSGNLNVGDVIKIYSNSPKLYEVVNIVSDTNMQVAGFNYDNFSDSVGYVCDLMYSNSSPESGSLYYFNDVPSGEGIDDGGNDMYDGGNYLNTNLFSSIPYTHSRMSDPPVNNTSQASFGDFVFDGSIMNGDSYFNTGSNYFTNLYPGLFVMVAYDVAIDTFFIDGSLGADGSGVISDYSNTFSGYTAYGKLVSGAQDPSVNHIMIVNTIDSGITHTYSLNTDNDSDTLSNLSGVTKIHYLLFALAGGVEPTYNQINSVVESYLLTIDESNLNNTLSNLNSNYSAITSNLPANNFSYDSLDYKQNNITGDTGFYKEIPTFNFNGNTILNNYVGNFANTKDWEGNTFLLANNVFYDNDYINNIFGDSCFNNTFWDDCSNNIVGSFFYNNYFDDDFDRNIIGTYFHDNYITSNFQYNNIGDNFYNNTIEIGSFYRNNVGNDFRENIMTNDDFQNNEIGNQFNNNFVYGQFYKNDIGNGYNNNNIYGEFYSNFITNGYNNNNIYCQFHENVIGEYFESNNIGDPLSLGSFNFIKNNIGTSFTNNNILGTFSYNKIGNNFYSNTIGDGFGFGYSTSQGNNIGNYFYSNTIGEYFYNNVIADGFYSNIAADYFQLNNVKTSVSSVDFTPASHVYGTYNCEIFKRQDSNNRLSYYDGADVIQIVNIDA